MQIAEPDDEDNSSSINEQVQPVFPLNRPGPLKDSPAQVHPPKHAKIDSSHPELPAPYVKNSGKILQS